MFHACLLVFELLEGIDDVVWHGDVDIAFFVVPFELEAAEGGAFPVLCDFILESKGVAKVFSMFFAHIFDAKVVDDEGKGDGPCFMFEEARSVPGLVIAMLCEVRDEFIGGDFACLGEAVHSFAYFSIDISVDCNVHDRDCIGR